MKNTIQQTDAQPGIINLIFNYPYQLTLPPASYAVNVKGEIGVVRIQHEEGVLIFDRGKTTIDASGGNKFKTHHRKFHKGEMKVVLKGGSCTYCDFDIYGSMCFPQKYTNIQVMFPVNDIRANPAQPDNSKVIKNLAEKFFKRFLLVYMYVTGDFTIRYNEKFSLPKQEWIKVHRFSENEIYRWRKDDDWVVSFMLKNKKFEIYPGYEDKNGFVCQEIASTDYGNVVKRNCSEDQFKNAFLTMATDKHIQNYYDFLFDAIRKAHMDENYPLALVDLATAVEVALSDNYCLLYYCVNRVSMHIDENKFNKIIEDYSNRSLKEDRGKNKSRVNLYDDVRNKVEKFIGINYENLYRNEFLENWHNTVWKKRHLIVHRGERLIDKEYFKDALEVTQKVLNKIKIGDNLLKDFVEKSNKI